MKEAPAEIPKIKQNQSERHERYRLMVEDCWDIVNTVDRNEYLRPLPKDVACWLIDNGMKHSSHTIMIKKRAVVRLTRLRDIVAEIEGLQAADAIRSVYLDTFEIFASERGRWLVAVKELVTARTRLELIKAELSSFRASPYIPYCSDGLSTLSHSLGAIIWDYIDIHELHSVLDSEAPRMMKHSDRLHDVSTC